MSAISETSAGIKTRFATTADLAAAQRLMQITMGESFVLSPALWETVCTGGAHRALVAEQADVVCGLAILEVSERIRLAASSRRRRFHLDELIVLPEFRRQGIGKRLLGEVIRIARTEAPSYILVNCDFTNVAARKTYEAAGLVLVRQAHDRFEIAF